MNLEAKSPSEEYAIYFEDTDGSAETYLIDCKELSVIASMRIYEELDPPLSNDDNVYLIWNDESTRAGVVINDELYALFDLLTRKMRTIENREDIIPLDRGLFFVGLHGSMGEDFHCFELETFEKN
ncbi:DUF2251 domain-containing protein [Guggenheimella bovis]